MCNKLPYNWIDCFLEDVILKIANGSSTKQYGKKVGYPITRIETIWDEKIDLHRVKYVKEHDNEFIKKYSLKKDDILLSHINSDSHLGKTAIFKNQTEILIHGINLLLIRSSSLLNADFLNYQFKYLKFKGVFIDVAQRAVNQSSINQRKLKAFNIRLPPLLEQRAIVYKIEQLFSDLDNGIENFKKAQEQLKIYRQAVLKNACEGKLVPIEAELARAEGRDYEAADVLLERILAMRHAKWEVDLRAKGKDPKKTKYVEPQLPNIEDLPPLPLSWMWVSWEAILAYENGAFKRGPFGSTLTKSIFVESGYKVYEQYCPINDDCSFGRYYITPEKFEELKAFEVKAGDYLVSCSGVTLGRITRVPQEFDRGIINQALLRVRINDHIISHLYFLYLFRSPFFQKLLFDNSTGTAIPNVKGVKELKAIPIPLPPLAEQLRIVVELERRLSICDKMEITIAESLQKSKSLRQSILKKAFEGKLLNEKELEEARNAPDWEPAEKLVERIRQEKQIKENNNKRTRRKTHG